MSTRRTGRLLLESCQRLAIAGLLLAALPIAAGCGKSSRLPIAGKVAVDGVPVYRGSISFVHSTGEGPSAGAGIEKGVFALSAAHGLQPGEYQATVQALSRTGKVAQDPLRGPVDEIVPIPLVAPAVTIVVSAENADRLSFELNEKR